MARTSTTSKAVKPVERSRETPTVPGSEGIDGVNGGGDSAQQPSLKRPRPAGDRDPEDPVLLRRRVPTSSLGGCNVCFSTTTSRWRSFLPSQQQSCPTRHVQWHLPTIATGRIFCGTYVHVALAHDRNGPHNLWRLPE